MSQVPLATVQRKIGVGSRDFILLVCGQWVSQLGDGIYNVALPLFALAEWGTGASLGLIMATALFPFTLLAPFAGVFADRWNRRLVIIFADLARGVITLGVAYLAWKSRRDEKRASHPSPSTAKNQACGASPNQSQEKERRSSHV